MFERFTDRARRVVVLAQEEGRTLRHNYIGTEHLLTGLAEEEHGIAAQILNEHGLTLAKVRAEVLKRVDPGKDTPSGHIPFTPRAKKVLELSLREALTLGHSYIGTEHLLVGLAREGEGIGAMILQEQGLSYIATREAVIEKLKEHVEEEENSLDDDELVPHSETRTSEQIFRDIHVNLQQVSYDLKAYVDKRLEEHGQ